VGARHLGLDFAGQSGVACKVEQVTGTIRIPLGPQCLAGKAGAAVQQDAHAQPRDPDAIDDAFDLLKRSGGGGVDVGATQPVGQRIMINPCGLSDCVAISTSI